MGKHSLRLTRSRSSKLAKNDSPYKSRAINKSRGLKGSTSKTAKKKYTNPHQRVGSNLNSLKSLVYNNPYNGRYANIYASQD